MTTIHSLHARSLSTCCRALALTALLTFTLTAAAEKADNTKPIRYSANSLDGNEAEQTVLLSGKVEVVQGTIVLKADRVVLKQQPDGTYNVSATGKPVVFRQKVDNSDEFVDAQALRVEYIGTKELVELYEQAWIKRGKDELRGHFLTYNSSSGAFAGRGSSPAAPAGDGRVTGVIQPKSKDAPKPDAKAPEGAKLQPAPNLSEPPK
ncbi:MAG: lipopolysaccharide transport periplasmic protein LptA [Betaproteobacteria bacterium]